MDDFGKWFNSFGSLTDEDTTESATNDGSTDTNESIGSGTEQTLINLVDRQYNTPYGCFMYCSLNPLREEVSPNGDYTYYDDDMDANMIVCQYLGGMFYRNDSIATVQEDETEEVNLTLHDPFFPYVGFGIANQVEIMYLDPHGTQIHSIKCPSRLLDQDLKDEIIRDYRRQLVTQTLALDEEISCSDLLAIVCGYKDRASMLSAWVVYNVNNKISWRKFIERELEHLDKESE